MSTVSAFVGVKPNVSLVKEYYPFDENFTSTAGNCNPNIRGDINLQTGKFGNSAFLDGVGDNFDLGTCGDDIFTEHTTSKSVWGWFEVNQTNDLGIIWWEAAEGYMILRYETDPVADDYFEVEVRAENLKAFSKARYSTPSINDGFYHVVGVWDNDNGNLSIYVNGVYRDSILPASFTGELYAYITPASFGSERDNIGGDYYYGKLDEMGFTTEVLNQSHVDFLYNGGTMTSEQQYPFEATPVPPTNPTILNASCTDITIGSNSSTPFSVLYTSASDENLDNFTYDIYLENLLFNYEYTLDVGQYETNVTKGLNISLNGQNLTTGLYNINITTTDSTNLTNSTVSSCTFSVCINDWEQQLGECLSDSTQLITYTDINACGLSYDVPIDNGTTQACTYVAPPTQDEQQFLAWVLIVFSIGGFVLLYLTQNTIMGIIQIFILLSTTTYFYTTYDSWEITLIGICLTVFTAFLSYILSKK